MFQRRYIVGIVVIIGIAVLFLFSPALQETFFNITLSLQKYAATNGIMAPVIFFVLVGLSALHATFVGILLFRLALPAEILGYALGITRYHFGKYIGAPFPAEAPFAFGATR